MELDTAALGDRRSAIEAIPGIVAHSVGGVFGAGSLFTGLALGKIVGMVTGCDLADSPSLRAGGEACLALNGIVPTVLWEGDDQELTLPPDDDDARLRSLRSTPLLVANHISYLDAMVLPLCLGWPRFMAMKEIHNWPLFGALGDELGAIWVDRNCKDSRADAMTAIGSHIAAWHAGDRPMIIFPEGTTSNGKSLLEFKKGAFLDGTAVRPVIIKYTGSWNPANTNFREAAPAGESRGSLPHGGRLGGREPGGGGLVGDGAVPGETVPYSEEDWAMQFAGHFKHTCTVLVCKPYEPSEEERADHTLFASNVRKVMARHLEDLHAVYDGDQLPDVEAVIARWRRRRQQPDRCGALEASSLAVAAPASRGDCPVAPQAAWRRTTKIAAASAASAAQRRLASRRERRQEESPGAGGYPGGGGLS